MRNASCDLPMMIAFVAGLWVSYFSLPPQRQEKIRLPFAVYFPVSRRRLIAPVANVARKRVGLNVS